MADLERLTDLIKTEAETLGFELVRVKLTGSGDERTLQVMAEDPASGQMLMEQCAQLSRAISAIVDALDEAGDELIEGAYMLEVSSPGIDRPLTRAKDYANWTGHDVNVSLNEVLGDGFGEEHAKARRLKGVLTGIDDDMVSVDDKRIGPVAVPLSQIHSARLILTDRLIAATQPLDISGADEIEEIPQNEHEQETEEKADH